MLLLCLLGTVFALMQFVLSIFVFLGPLLMVYIFQMTSISFHSAVYVVSVAILILPLLFTRYVYLNSPAGSWKLSSKSIRSIWLDIYPTHAVLSIYVWLNLPLLMASTVKLYSVSIMLSILFWLLVIPHWDSWMTS